MKKLLAAILIAAGLWAGYWYTGQRAVERALADWFDARRQAGWVAEYDTLNTGGFPNRFDTTITGPSLADPASGLAWSAPFLQILALSYRPNHVILALPNEQVVATPLERLTLASDKMTGSLILRPGTALELDRSTFIAQSVAVTGQSGWSASMDEGRAAIRRLDGDGFSYEIGLETLGLRPADALRRALDPTGRLPEAIQTLRLDATAEFDRPWDRRAIEEARPQPVALSIDEMKAQWGQLSLHAAGNLTVDADGIPEGTITLRATNWRDILGLVADAGLVPNGVLPLIESALRMLAGLSGSDETLEAPLTFASGRVALGPIPLGAAPVLRLR